MNKARRERLKESVCMLNKVSDLVYAVFEDEQDCVDNYPENLQGTDKYERMELALSDLEDAMERLSEAESCIMSAAG